MGGVRNISLLVDGKEERFKSYAIKETKILKDKIGSIVTIWSYPWNDSFFIERNRIIEIEIDNKRIFNDWGEIKSKYDKKNYFIFIFLGFLMMFISLFLVFFVLRKYN
ncbi:MAG: hypothetical protein K6L74_15040 [Neptuniibacter sp.]